jgi:hypothetical protein
MKSGIIMIFCSVELVEGGSHSNRARSDSVKNTVRGFQDFRRRQQKSEFLVRKFEKIDPFDSGESAKPIVATSGADVHRIGAGSNLKNIRFQKPLK